MFRAFDRAAKAQEMAIEALTAAKLAATKIDEHVRFCTEREAKRDGEHHQNLEALKEMRGSISWLNRGALAVCLTLLGYILSHALDFKVTFH